MQDTSVISLLQKYIKNQCTEDELRTLLQWLKKPDDSVSLDWVIKPLWDTIDKNMVLPDCERENELQKEVSLLLSNMKRKELDLSLIHI